MVITKPSDNFATWNDLGVNASALAGESARVTRIRKRVHGSDSTAFPNRAIQGPNPNLSEDLSWIKGAHQIGFGVELSPH